VQFNVSQMVQLTLLNCLWPGR